MIMRVWIAYRVELIKALRTKRTYAGPLLVLLVVAGAVLRQPVLHDGISDYSYIVYATRLALHLLGFAVLLIYCAGLIAIERESGSLRQVLTRPLLRHEYLLAKLLHAMTYVLLLTAVTGFASWGIALGLGDVNGVIYGGDLIHTNEEMLRAYILGAALSLAPLWAAAAYALLISTIVRPPIAAALIALPGVVLIDMIKYRAGIAPLVFTTYLEAPLQVFADYADGLSGRWWPMARDCLVYSAVAFGGFTAAAAAVLHRRDLA